MELAEKSRFASHLGGVTSWGPPVASMCWASAAKQC